MAFVVDMVQIFKFSMWTTVRLSFAFGCNSHFRAAKCFSTQEKELLQSASPTGFKEEGNERHSGSPKSHPPPCSYKGLTPPNNLPWQCKSRMKSTGQAASSREEFRNLREDDFSKQQKRPVPKPLSIERTKGSEILFGIAPCSLAFSQSKRDFFRLFLKSSSSSTRPVMEEFAQQAEARGVPVHRVRRQVLDALCKGQVHQGVCLETTPLHPRSLEEAEASQIGVASGPNTQMICLVLEQIQDPMNLGAVLRSAYFFGVDRVVISKKDGCSLTPTVSKASAGAMEVLKVYNTDNLEGFLKAKTEEGWEVVGTVSKSEVEDNVPVINCLEFHWNKPTILALGNEGYGLSSKTRSLCQRMLIIPPGRMLEPRIESLNVSVATGKKKKLVKLIANPISSKLKNFRGFSCIQYAAKKQSNLMDFTMNCVDLLKSNPFEQGKQFGVAGFY